MEIESPRLLRHGSDRKRGISQFPTTRTTSPPDEGWDGRERGVGKIGEIARRGFCRSSRYALRADTHRAQRGAIEEIIKILLSPCGSRASTALGPARGRTSFNPELSLGVRRPAGNLARFYERPKNPINIVLIQPNAPRITRSRRCLPRERAAGSSKDTRYYCATTLAVSSRSTRPFRVGFQPSTQGV